ncbi:MAG: Na/Pi cotransporter family protein [Clostridiales bacterium]|nr:Na/Pi cotransporter family protein [Clostridiales bacterium]
MNESLKVLFGLIGGLAMFLYGMNTMSDNLQKVAGDRMRKILGFLTSNRVMGALAGALVTAVLQSSSATTVMVIGFVSSGLMTLPQAISVIFGANIGTTMTAQLMAFKISNYIYPIIFIGFIMYFAGKKERVKNIGMVIFSFGLLFEGIEIMGSTMKPLAGSAIFTDLMGQVSHIPVLGILLGAVMTLVVQSSSATIAVLQNFASQAGPDGVTSVIGLTGAIPILLGDNIGTTITALLASIGQSRNAKRTAIAHSFFNITGSVVFACIIPVFANFVRMISPSGPEVEVISRQIANAHTTFNIACTLIWLPLLPLMVKLVTTVIPGEDQKTLTVSQPKYLDEKVLGQPLPALCLISQEIDRCAGYTLSLLNAVKAEILGDAIPNVDVSSEELFQSVKNLQEQIAQYISRLFSRGVLTEEQAELTAGLLFVVNHVDRIADRCGEIGEKNRLLKNDGVTFSREASAELEDCFTILGRMFEEAMDCIRTGSDEAVESMTKDKNQIHRAQKKYNKNHLVRVRRKICNSTLTQDYGNILYSLDRIADNCTAIAEESQDQVSFVTLNAAIDAVTLEEETS